MLKSLGVLVVVGGLQHFSVGQRPPGFGFDPSFTEFVYPECWHFEKGATWNLMMFSFIMVDFVLSLIVHLKFCWLDK